MSGKVLKKLRSFATMVGDGCIVTGGHLMLRGENPLDLNEGTIVSFTMANEVCRLSGKKNVNPGLLINNIGSTCESNVCYVVSKDSAGKFVLPKPYRDILVKNGFRLPDLHILWEKHLRNRGKKEFIKRVKKINNFIKHDNGWWFKEDGKQFLLTRQSAKDSYGTPACPLIMAAFALEQEKMGYSSSLNYWYIGDDNYDNIPNHFMIEKGYDVARIFGAKIKVKNVYFTKDKVITNFTR